MFFVVVWNVKHSLRERERKGKNESNLKSVEMEFELIIDLSSLLKEEFFSY